MTSNLDRPAGLGDALLQVLTTAGPSAKAEAAKLAAEFGDHLPAGDWPPPPDRPARPAKPPLVQPGGVERRRLGSEAGRAALLHAIAHIEFNAIDLAFDMALRFGRAVLAEGLDAAAFVKTWVDVGADEARHFLMVCERLSALGFSYGDLPAHDGLWQHAQLSADDVLARLAVAPLALEARGLDVTPGLIDRLSQAGDSESADILNAIYRDEIGHVSAGVFWFETICERRGIEPGAAFRALIAERLRGGLKAPFNEGARTRAGLDRSYYNPTV